MELGVPFCYERRTGRIRLMIKKKWWKTPTFLKLLPNGLVDVLKSRRGLIAPIARWRRAENMGNQS